MKGKIFLIKNSNLTLIENSADDLNDDNRLCELIHSSAKEATPRDENMFLIQLRCLRIYSKNKFSMKLEWSNFSAKKYSIQSRN